MQSLQLLYVRQQGCLTVYGQTTPRHNNTVQTRFLLLWP